MKSAINKIPWLHKGAFVGFLVTEKLNPKNDNEKMEIQTMIDELLKNDILWESMIKPLIITLKHWDDHQVKIAERKAYEITLSTGNPTIHTSERLHGKQSHNKPTEILKPVAEELNEENLDDDIDFDDYYVSFNEEMFQICRNCGDDYHHSALHNGYCMGCSNESFSINDGRRPNINTDKDDCF